MKKLFLLLLFVSLSVCSQERFRAAMMIAKHMETSKNWDVKFDKKEKTTTFINTVEKYTITYERTLDIMKVVMDNGEWFYIDNLSKGGLYEPMAVLIQRKKIKK